MASIYHDLKNHTRLIGLTEKQSNHYTKFVCSGTSANWSKTYQISLKLVLNSVWIDQFKNFTFFNLI